MSGTGTFSRLSLELSLDERANLLEKLKNQSVISKDPLYEEKAAVSSVNLEQQFKRLPWYSHLWYFILSLFMSKPPQKLYENREILKLGKVIDARAPGLYDYNRGLLLSEFHTEFNKLKEGSRFFYSALDTGVNRDKGAFYAFLGSLEMGAVHTRLSGETDPIRIAERNPGASESELRHIALSLMEEILAMISEEERAAMYADTRSLNCLSKLSSFLFDRIIMAFAFNSAVSGMTCAASVVWEPLSKLNDILFSLKEIPPMSLLESLFIFILQDHAGEPGFDINLEIRKLLTKAENSINSIREFNKQVPLTLVVRCGARDLSLCPQAISGGEEWFAVYRDHWKRHIETLFNEYIRERRHREVMNAFQYFFKGTNLKVLNSAVSESNPNGFPARGAFSLSFLLTFYSAVFMTDINTFLRLILIDGEFYRREHRLEFTENYNELIKLEDMIRKFDEEISPTGDLGKRYLQAKGDMTSLPVKRRKIQLVMEAAAEESAKIVEQAKTAMGIMIQVLKKIIQKDSDGKYEALINMSKLTGKGTEFVQGLTDSIEKLQKALQLMSDIEVMEMGK